MSKRVIKCASVYSYDGNMREYKILVMTFRGDTLCHLRASIKPVEDTDDYVYKLMREDFINWEVVATKRRQGWLDCVLDEMVDKFINETYNFPTEEYVVEKHLSI